VLEVGYGALDEPGPGAHRAGHPVEGAQLVEDRPLDPVDRIRLELEPTLELELVDGIDEPEQPVAGQVVLVHRTREPGPDAARHVFHQRRVMEDQPLAGVGVSRGLEALP
jgi:hypothetical protein